MPWEPDAKHETISAETAFQYIADDVLRTYEGNARYQAEDLFDLSHEELIFRGVAEYAEHLMGFIQMLQIRMRG